MDSGTTTASSDARLPKSPGEKASVRAGLVMQDSASKWSSQRPPCSASIGVSVYDVGSSTQSVHFHSECEVSIDGLF